MTKKSTYALTVFDAKAADALGLDSWVRQVDYVGTFPSKAAFVRAVILVRPHETQSALSREVYDWGFRPEYIAEGVLYVQKLTARKGDPHLLLSDVTAKA